MIPAPREQPPPVTDCKCGELTGNSRAASNGDRIRGDLPTKRMAHRPQYPQVFAADLDEREKPKHLHTKCIQGRFLRNNSPIPTSTPKSEAEGSGTTVMLLI